MKIVSKLGIHTGLLLVYVLSGGLLSAEEVRFKSFLDNNRIYIGDQVNYTLELTIPTGYYFEWPHIYDSIAPSIEIVRKSTIDTVRLAGNLMQVRQVFVITSFDTGYYLIPPVALRYRTTPDDSDFRVVETEPFVLNVHTIPVDLTQPIKPIKDPFSVPLTVREILPWILGVLIFAAVIYWLLTRRKKPVSVSVSRPKPDLPPYLWALEELEKLRNEKLWQKGLVKEYYSRLSWIVRMYLEEQFLLPAVESSTSEIIQMIRSTVISQTDGEILSELLSLADLVKFAKAIPLPTENDQSISLAEKFIKNTSRLNVAKESINNGPTSEVLTETLSKNHPED